MIEEKAYAKINLHLEVLGKRDNGYHDIFSFMVSTHLHDTIKVDSLTIIDSSTSLPEIEIYSDGGKFASLLDNIPLEGNLVTKAVKRYFHNTGKSATMKIGIEKNIPAGAGLGGGSSDAAAILRVLNRELNLYNGEELISLAADIGADVPFCLISGAAFCEGIGEVLTPVEKLPIYYVVILNNGIHVNTVEAYKAVDAYKKFEDYDSSSLLLKKKEVLRLLNERVLDEKGDMLINDFEFPIYKKHSELRELKEKLYSLKADFALMTGSGSSIVGLFKDSDLAEQAVKSLSDIVQQVYMTSIGSNL